VHGPFRTSFESNRQLYDSYCKLLYMYLVHVLANHNCTLDIGLVSRCKVVARLQHFTSFVPTHSLTLFVVVTVLICMSAIVTTYTIVVFHTQRACTTLHVMGPRLKSLTRDNFPMRAAIYDTRTEGNTHKACFKKST
jgi:hypothetical protein